MRETPLSICEKEFITQTIKQNHRRLDGRKIDEFRNIKINFGHFFGSVMVSLGETKVVAQVSCELGTPLATRSQEGVLYINVDVGPMAAPHFEVGRSDLTVQLNRILERNLKDSRAVDLESLCVIAEERIWVIRVDINVLNHEGNLIDCCSIAALTALAHFKRPDVSVKANNVHIHSAAEKEFIPLVMHHYPVCINYCIFDGNIAVADPTSLEERTSESHMIFGINSYRELCCLNLGNTILTDPQLLLNCSKRAASRAKYLVDMIKNELEKDKTLREAGHTVGFSECIRLNQMTALAEDRLAIRLPDFSFRKALCNEDETMPMEVDSDTIPKQLEVNVDIDDSGPSSSKKVKILHPQAVILETNQPNIRWMPEESDDDGNIVMDNLSDGDYDDSDDDDDGNVKQKFEDTLHDLQTKARIQVKKKTHGDSESNSEEEDKIIL